MGGEGEGSGGCERRIEVYVKIHKKKIFPGGGAEGVRWGGGRDGGGGGQGGCERNVRGFGVMWGRGDVNQE